MTPSQGVDAGADPAGSADPKRASHRRDGEPVDAGIFPRRAAEVQRWICSRGGPERSAGLRRLPPAQQTRSRPGKPVARQQIHLPVAQLDERSATNGEAARICRFDSCREDQFNLGKARVEEHRVWAAEARGRSTLPRPKSRLTAVHHRSVLHAKSDMPGSERR